MPSVITLLPDKRYFYGKVSIWFTLARKMGMEDRDSEKTRVEGDLMLLGRKGEGEGRKRKK